MFFSCIYSTIDIRIGEKKMKINTRAFTLIELLAVIVILAIIALIATPIVLSIINESKENARLRSAEMYIKGLETSVATATLHNKVKKDDTYPIMSDGNICLKYNEQNPSVCEEKLEIKMNGEVPSSWTVTIQNGQIKDIELKYSSDKTIVKDTTGNLKYQKTFKDICKHVSGTEKTVGAKYTCEVKPGTSYNFYVLTTPTEGDTTINLIMDRNICEDGTPTDASKENKCLVAWQTSGANADGPVTAMTFLYNATKDWTNIPNIEMNYTDEGNTGGYGYGTIVTTDNVTKITKKDGTAVTVLTNQEGYSNLKARLPYKSEVANSNGSNEYLYENLDGSNWYGSGTQPTNNISGIYGYWTFSSIAGNSYFAWYVDYSGGVSGSYVGSDGTRGVRAVINLKI